MKIPHGLPWQTRHCRLLSYPLVVFLSLIGPILSFQSPCIHTFCTPLINRPSKCITAPHSLSTTTALSYSLPRLSEDDLARPPDPRVISSASLSYGRGVTAADVASSSGISLSLASRDLSSLVSLSGGDVAVSADGDLVYRFPSNLKGALAQNSARYKLTKTWDEDVRPKLFYGVRVGFGVALLVSIAAIFSTIAFVSASSSSSDDDRRDDRRRGGGGMNFNFFFGPSPLDFFYYRPYYGYYGQSYYDGRGYERKPEPEMGFLESIFSYIFGDGDPNVGVEDRRISAAAEMIRRDGGAVTAEQLAPFAELPPETGADDKVFVDESYALTVVAKLGGEPTVTDDGDIIYLFPDLMTTSASSPPRDEEAAVLRSYGLPPGARTVQIKEFMQQRLGYKFRGLVERNDLVKALAKQIPDSERKTEDAFSAIQESEYSFSLASDFQKVLAGGLGLVNLFGAVYLGNILSSPALVGVKLPSYMGLVQGGFPFLLGYALLYNIIPAARYFWQKRANGKIRERNKQRRQVMNEVAGSQRNSRIGKKLESAKKFAQQLKQLRREDFIYDTQQDIEEVTMNRENDDLKSFDEKFKSM
mmetsp:Transcript_19875/g.45121  ORF Transcript_19875/g.45121 Transcript_19875/m.45121 type:complete len:587 (-) Transcript_19875:403-2163(-)